MNGAMLYRGRGAVRIENGELSVTVLREGGHIAEMRHKASGINPLWTPPWPTIEPSAYDPARHPEYGWGAEAKLLAGIMGHNLCLDLFGEPSAEEAEAGLSVHGEAPVAAYEIRCGEDRLVMSACLPLAQMRIERTVELRGPGVAIHETVENLTSFDRPIAWTQHVTLGPPFLEVGVTRFEVSAGRSKVFETAFGAADYLEPGGEFDWPMAPRAGGGTADLSRLHSAPAASAFTTHLMDPRREDAFFTAFHPGLELSFGYRWRRSDFPWLGIWEENCSRRHAPWNGRTITRGMEFGVSPMPETRQRMVGRGALFGVPACRWLAARGRIEVAYSAGFNGGAG